MMITVEATEVLVLTTDRKEKVVAMLTVQDRNFNNQNVRIISKEERHVLGTEAHLAEQEEVALDGAVVAEEDLVNKQL